MAKNFRKRRDKRWKKKAKQKASLLSSSGGESEHYISQSIYRSGSLKPIRRKVIGRKAKLGYLKLQSLTTSKILVIDKKNSNKRIVSKNLKGGITYMNN